jgi:hypothetical protein
MAWSAKTRSIDIMVRVRYGIVVEWVNGCMLSRDEEDTYDICSLDPGADVPHISISIVILVVVVIFLVITDVEVTPMKLSAGGIGTVRPAEVESDIECLQDLPAEQFDGQRTRNKKNGAADVVASGRIGHLNHAYSCDIELGGVASEYGRAPP